MVRRIVRAACLVLLPAGLAAQAPDSAALADPAAPAHDWRVRAWMDWLPPTGAVAEVRIRGPWTVSAAFTEEERSGWVGDLPRYRLLGFGYSRKFSPRGSGWGWRSSGTYSVVAGVAEFGGSWGFTGGIDAAAHGRLTDWFGVALGVLAGGSGEGFYLVPRGGLSLTF